MTFAVVRISPRNMWDLMTLSGSVAPATGLEYANTQNTARGSVWRSPDATAQTLQGSMATGSFRANCAYLFRHHCHGGTVRFRAWSNNDWTGTLLVDTTVSTIYTPISTGYDHGYADVASSDTHDPLGTESPYFVYFTGAAGIKSIQWDFASKSTTYGYAYWEVGRVFVGNYLEATYPVAWGSVLGIEDFSTSDTTMGGSNRTAPGATRDTLNFDLARIPEAEVPAWIDIRKICRISRDVVASVYAGVGGRLERDHTINGKFKMLDPLNRPSLTGLTTKVQIVGN